MLPKHPSSSREGLTSRASKVPGASRTSQYLLSGRRGNLKIRTLIASAVIGVSSLALIVPSAHASGSVCYSAQVTVNGDDVVNQAGCQELP